MNRVILVIFLIGFFSFGINSVFAQEPQLATFQETVQIILDNQISGNVTASITLQSTSNQEFKIPSELEQKILQTPNLNSITITNEKQCVLGVVDESCIMINVQLVESGKGIIAIQDETKAIGDTLIDDLNDVFDTNAQYHSVFVHQGSEINVALETSGAVTGVGTVSAVYTMPKEDTGSMYDKLSALLLPKIIRDSGGFYSVAKNLSSEPNSKMMFSIIPIGNSSLFMLKLNVDYSDAADISKISPLEFLKTKELKRSEYFSSGFYPLNSLVHVILLSPQDDKIKNTNSNILETISVQDELVPTELTKNGWVFDPISGEKIEGKYLFGKEVSVSDEELLFTLSSYQGEEIIQQAPSEINEETIILMIIAIAAAGATGFYIKGYKKEP